MGDINLDLNSDSKTKISILSAVSCAAGGLSLAWTFGHSLAAAALGTVLGGVLGYAAAFRGTSFAFRLILVSVLAICYAFVDRDGKVSDYFRSQWDSATHRGEPSSHHGPGGSSRRGQNPAFEDDAPSRRAPRNPY